MFVDFNKILDEKQSADFWTKHWKDRKQTFLQEPKECTIGTRDET